MGAILIIVILIIVVLTNPPSSSISFLKTYGGKGFLNFIIEVISKEGERTRGAFIGELIKLIILIIIYIGRTVS